MKLKTKLWLVSQGLLILTALIIQMTFYKAIKVGPILGMAKRSYTEIIQDADIVIPQSILEQNLPPEAYDARLPLSKRQIEKANLSAYRRAAQQESGLRTALWGGLIVNLIYVFAFHLLYFYFSRSIKRHERSIEI